MAIGIITTFWIGIGWCLYRTGKAIRAAVRNPKL